MLGFGGHISTKSRRYSTTLTALRRARAAFAARRGRRQVAELAGSSRRETVEAEAVMVLARWRYLGSGYQTEGEAWLARSAAADAREQRRVASRAGDGMTAEERTRIQEAGRRYVREQAPRPPVAVLERVARIVVQAMGTIRSATVPDVTGVDAGRPEAA
jgi:hypothetical protein